MNLLDADRFAIATGPAPGVATLTAALTDATASTPGLRSISVVEPYLRALEMVKKELTGTYAFVGSATGAAKLTDSVSGQLLAAWVDQRFGGLSVKNVDVWEWGDADNVMNYWANGRSAAGGDGHSADGRNRSCEPIRRANKRRWLNSGNGEAAVPRKLRGGESTTLNEWFTIADVGID
jgi:hypothetical protein